MSGNAFPPRPHLTTPRLTLNALTPADCGDYAALCRDVRRNRWWGYDYREEQPHPPEEWFLQASEEDYAAGRELGLAVRLRGRWHRGGGVHPLRRPRHGGAGLPHRCRLCRSRLRHRGLFRLLWRGA